MSEAIHVSVIRHTKNYEAMLGFYRDSLGMSIKESWEEPDNRGTLLSLGGRASNVLIEVVQVGNEAIPGAKPVNLALSIDVAEVDAWHDHLRECGVTIARGLEDAPWGQRSFGIDDPDGLRIWYYQDLNPK
jgi:uncharacterized glyoxalase superfamily protein PhnB